MRPDDVTILVSELISATVSRSHGLKIANERAREVSAAYPGPDEGPTRVTGSCVYEGDTRVILLDVETPTGRESFRVEVSKAD